MDTGANCIGTPEPARRYPNETPTHEDSFAVVAFRRARTHPPPPATAADPGVFAGPVAGPARLGDPVQGDPVDRQSPVLPQDAGRPSPAPGLAVREDQRGVAPEAVCELGPRRQDRDLRGPLPDPEGTAA